MTFFSPSWRSLSHWKGHVFTIAKKVTIAELPGCFFSNKKSNHLNTHHLDRGYMRRLPHFALAKWSYDHNSLRSLRIQVSNAIPRSRIQTLIPSLGRAWILRNSRSNLIHLCISKKFWWELKGIPSWSNKKPPRFHVLNVEVPWLTQHEPRKKTSYFPWNTGSLIGILISWFMK